MTIFWVIAGIFITIALLFIIPVLWRGEKHRQRHLIERQAANVTIYRDQLAELERDLRDDILSQEQYELSKQELQKRMLLDVSDEEEIAHPTTTNRRGVGMSVMLTLFIPLVAIYLYLEIGDTRGLLSQAQLASATQFQGAGADGMPSDHEIRAMVDSLAARLKDNPDDIEGWIMLGRSYGSMQRFDEAAAAYAQLVDRVPDNPRFMSDYADMLAMANNGSLRGKPEKLIKQALEVDPNYPKALALAGSLEFEQEQYSHAVGYWQRLLNAMPEEMKESDFYRSVSDSINQARRLAAGGGGDMPMAMQFAQSSNTSSAQNTQSTDSETQEAPVADESQPAPNSGVPSVSGSVALDAALADKVAKDDILFIFARASQGSKMPLAILRLQAKDLPADFKLDDNMAMTPMMKLSSLPEVVIEARISKTGQAVPSSGDLEGYSEPVKIGAENVSITIDRVIP